MEGVHFQFDSSGPAIAHFGEDVDAAPGVDAGVELGECEFAVGNIGGGLGEVVGDVERVFEFFVLDEEGLRKGGQFENTVCLIDEQLEEGSRVGLGGEDLVDAGHIGTLSADDSREGGGGLLIPTFTELKVSDKETGFGQIVSQFWVVAGVDLKPLERQDCVS